MLTAEVAPLLLLRMYKSYFCNNSPTVETGKTTPCKQKEGKARDPLCMLDSAGKVKEKLMRTRLHTAIEAASNLTERQYGFRRGRSTIGAVQETAQRAYHKVRQNRYKTLAVRNAVNPAKCTDVFRSLRSGI